MMAGKKEVAVFLECGSKPPSPFTEIFSDPPVQNRSWSNIKSELVTPSSITSTGSKPVEEMSAASAGALPKLVAPNEEIEGIEEIAETPFDFRDPEESLWISSPIKSKIRSNSFQISDKQPPELVATMRFEKQVEKTKLVNASNKTHSYKITCSDKGFAVKLYIFPKVTGLEENPVEKALVMIDVRVNRKVARNIEDSGGVLKIHVDTEVCDGPGNRLDDANRHTQTNEIGRDGHLCYFQDLVACHKLIRQARLRNGSVTGRVRVAGKIKFYVVPNFNYSTLEASGETVLINKLP